MEALCSSETSVCTYKPKQCYCREINKKKTRRNIGPKNEAYFPCEHCIFCMLAPWNPDIISGFCLLSLRALNPLHGVKVFISYLQCPYYMLTALYIPSSVSCSKPNFKKKCQSMRSYEYTQRTIPFLREYERCIQLVCNQAQRYILFQRIGYLCMNYKPFVVLQFQGSHPAGKHGKVRNLMKR